MEEKRYLTFALGKGRLAKKTLELFEKIGITGGAFSGIIYMQCLKPSGIKQIVCKLSSQLL